MSWWYDNITRPVSDFFQGPKELRDGSAQQEAAERAAAEARKPSDAEKAMAEHAISQYERLRDTYFPLQEQAAAEAGKDRTNLLAGRSNADLNAGMARTLAGTRMANRASGFSPDSGRSLSTMVDGYLTGAAGSSKVHTGAKQVAQGIIDSKRQGIVGLAHGLEADAGQSSLSAARNAASANLQEVGNRLGVINARNNAELTRAQARGGLAGSVLGSAVSLGTSFLGPSTDSGNMLAMNTGGQNGVINSFNYLPDGSIPSGMAMHT